MLHPKQFEVNETWIAFRLNDAPIRTERDGDFNCIALMDAASCFILSSEFIPATAAEPTQAAFRRLLKDAKRHKQQLPRTLFVPREDVAEIRLPSGEILRAELHWYEATGIGKREIKIKAFI